MSDEFQIGDWAIGDNFQGEVIHIEKFSLIRDLICIEIVWPTRLEGRTFNVYSTNLKKANPKIEDGDFVEYKEEDFLIRGYAYTYDHFIDIFLDKELTKLIMEYVYNAKLLRKAERNVK